MGKNEMIGRHDRIIKDIKKAIFWFRVTHIPCLYFGWHDWKIEDVYDPKVSTWVPWQKVCHKCHTRERFRNK